MVAKKPGIRPPDPLSYTGPKFNLMPVFGFTREPTVSDNTYLVSSFVVILDNPSSGDPGDLWYLSQYDISGDAIWLQIHTASSSPGIDFITTDDGSPPVEPDTNGNINILGGTGIDVTGTGPGDTVTISGSGAIVNLMWSVITTATKAIEVNNGYFSDRGAGVTFTLPATSIIGDTFIVNNINAGGFTISQNAGQTIFIGNQNTTTGIGGSINSTDLGDSLILVCSNANTDFRAAYPPQGNLILI